MPKIVDKQKKARAIGRAALGVFRRMGYHRTTMADIARAASVGKGTLYEYFRDKADILRFNFDDYFTAFQQGALEAMGKAPTAAGQLRALIEFALEHVADWEEHCAVYVDYLGVAKSEEKEALSLDRFYEEFKTVLSRLIAEGQREGAVRKEFTSEAAAEMLLALFDGVVLHGIFVEKSTDTTSIRAAALELVARGLFEKEGASTNSYK